MRPPLHRSPHPTLGLTPGAGAACDDTVVDLDPTTQEVPLPTLLPTQVHTLVHVRPATPPGRPRPAGATGRRVAAGASQKAKLLRLLLVSSLGPCVLIGVMLGGAQATGPRKVAAERATPVPVLPTRPTAPSAPAAAVASPAGEAARDRLLARVVDAMEGGHPDLARHYLQIYQIQRPERAGGLLLHMLGQQAGEQGP